ncbi:hypothetical protein V1509DRAFT_643481 [Lipomyces kononenkoae]
MAQTPTALPSFQHISDPFSTPILVAMQYCESSKGNSIVMLGLIDAVVENFPEAHHAHCLRHLHENLTKVVKNAEIAALVYRAASGPTRKEMGDVLASMPAEGPEHWADSYFAGLRFGHRTSNIAESFNSWMLEARGQPVLAMMERIREQMMLTRAKRLKEIQKLKDEGKKISNFAAKELAKSASMAREYNVVQPNVDEYEGSTSQLFIQLNSLIKNPHRPILHPPSHLCTWDFSGVRISPRTVSSPKLLKKLLTASAADTPARPPSHTHQPPSPQNPSSCRFRSNHV